MIAIRAVAAGALTGEIDRSVEDDAPVVVDFARAERFRALAAEARGPLTEVERKALLDLRS
ncbi:hypothetical protein [Micromonospora luteifusca]|uniref:hypothetical protein n=1 Tax=Micromonospora luteifusca TaxID=709860 RepID=UPI0033B9B704